eukprot:scaffold22578_cov164-Cylindrotheca_fusiformis.AAC.13
MGVRGRADEPSKVQDLQKVTNPSLSSAVPMFGICGTLELLCREGLCCAVIENDAVSDDSSMEDNCVVKDRFPEYTMDLKAEGLEDDSIADGSLYGGDDSTISSKGSIATDNCVKTPDYRPRPRAKRSSLAKREDSHRSEKSARFDDSLNETKVYTPDTRSHAYDDDANSVKSEGGEVRRFVQGSLKFLADQRFDVSVVGTSSKDDSVHPRVLDLSIMDALQDHLPYSKRGQLFWLRYSMVRDGASMHTLINKTSGSSHNLIAIETMDGEVFGAYTSQPWSVTWEFYGSTDSFLWRLKDLRNPMGAKRQKSKPRGFAQDLDVYKYAGHNRNIQLCTSDSLIVGGGHPDEASKEHFLDVKMNAWGFGLAFGKDLQQGTSAPCITFESPSLSRFHRDGSIFEVSNIEIWSLTPCLNLEQAMKLEESKRWVQKSPTY